MLTEEKLLNLMKEAGLDEEKFYQLLLKEEPRIGQLTDAELDSIHGGSKNNGFIIETLKFFFKPLTRLFSGEAELEQKHQPGWSTLKKDWFNQE